MMAMAMQLSYRHVRDGNIGVGLALLALLTGVPLGAACAADEQCLVVSAENIVTGSGSQKAVVTLTTNLSDFGKKVSVTVPPAKETMTSTTALPGLGG